MPVATHRSGHVAAVRDIWWEDTNVGASWTLDEGSADIGRVDLNIIEILKVCGSIVEQDIVADLW